MPRDSSGNYTLPAGNPVISGEVIASTWANPTMQDIASALTDSLSRSGNGGMIGAFRFGDGTAGAPSISFTAEPTTGFFRAALKDMQAVVNGQVRMRWTDTGVEFWNGTALVPFNTTFAAATHNQAAETITSGTLPDARLSADVARRNSLNNFQVMPQYNGLNLVRTDDGRLSDARTPIAHNQDASTITSGTLADTRLSSNVLNKANGGLYHAAGAIVGQVVLSTTDPGSYPNGTIVLVYEPG